MAFANKEIHRKTEENQREVTEHHSRKSPQWKRWNLVVSWPIIIHTNPVPNGRLGQFLNEK
jgi:hypothetical protein